MSSRRVRVELDDALKTLSSLFTERQMKVFVLSEAYGLNSSQISKALGGEVKPATVRSDLMRARRRLEEPRARSLLGMGPVPE